ncbi:peptidoglycan D,D-transpeptidase FtsI family protein [Pelagovum pacificum]|uniref:Penicillin-binding protein 2 n=1 Tax=Pelagovum pacificum TaxID=2588711 RepID=A0A5C5GDH3_9RHOB|nr:penicillin-binding protein 2 [Pelagovum pacificum]QQA44157.1 penicillin-binding protein 2 [Pelagovum pacificum]TNY32718.1 penicillin-binding protein 2 [Pelagovum pacificum]
MTRRPLRPLARILKARAEGGNPDAIEAENLRLRHEEMRDKARARAEGRLVVLGAMFFLAFATVGGRMGVLAASESSEPQVSAGGNPIIGTRADIVDRNGRILATNLETHSLYAHPQDIQNAEAAARGLVEIFPELKYEDLYELFTGDRRFDWIRREISPEQMQAVHEIGDPGLLFGPREMRLYPNGSVAAHILGGASYGTEGVSSAEVIGVAGVEKYFDNYLRDPANEGAPLELSVDLTVQAAVERVLQGGMTLMNAKGAAATVMNVHTGEVIALASLPDFDPNKRPVPPPGDRDDSPLFNRAMQGVYELGSVFKIFTAAQAIEAGLVSPSTMIDTKGPFYWGRFPIRDSHRMPDEMSVFEVVTESSNVGTARIAQMIGVTRQQEFLRTLGLLDPTTVEMVEAPTARPLLPPNWSELSTITISYGHGLSVSQLHIAQAYASLLNGGTRVTPTLVRRTGAPVVGERVVSEQTSRVAREMLRGVVTGGTASLADVPGYEVGGKTGTADKPTPRGGYYDDRVIASFASIFPASDPEYVLVVTLDEPMISILDEPRRTAGFTAAPLGAELIRRVAPLLGMRPDVETSVPLGVSLTAQ